MPEVPAIQPLDNPLTGLIRLQELHGLAQERQMRGQEMQALATEHAIKAKQLQDAQAAQQRANQALSQFAVDPDTGMYNVPEITKSLFQTGLAPEHVETLTKGFDGFNTIARQAQQDKLAHLSKAAGLLMDLHGPNDPVTADTIHGGVAALKRIAPFLVTDQDEQAITSAIGGGADPRHVLESIKKLGEKPQEFAGSSGVVFSKQTGQIVSGAKTPTNLEAAYEQALARQQQGTATPEDEAAIAAHRQAMQEKTKEAKPTGAEMEAQYLDLEKQRLMKQGLSEADATRRAYEKMKTLGPQATASMAIVPVQTVDAEGRPITEYKTRQQALAAGPIQKPLSGVVQNRVDASKAAVATGEDIIKQLQDPKVASQLGPAIGRFNTVREFIGNPPPELAQLAGEIESYSFAQMGVHGMRSTEGAKQIANLLDKKHTPASMISAIRGVNGFAQNYVQGATGKPITPAAAPAGGAGETPYQRYLRGGGTNR